MIPTSLSIEDEMNLITEQLKLFFSSSKLDQLARQIGFVKRKGKLTAIDFVSLCVYLNGDLATDSLTEFCSDLSSGTNVLLSTEGLNQRFNSSASKFLKTIFSTLLHAQIGSSCSIPILFDGFKRIRIMDSSTFQLPDQFADRYPGAGGSSREAGMKIQLEYELKSGQFLYLNVGNANEADRLYGSTRADSVEPGDLCIRDLGYFSLEDFKKIAENRGYFLSRLKTNVHIYTKKDTPIEYHWNGIIKTSSLYSRLDLGDIIESLHPGEVLEIPETYIGKQKKVCSRLIIYKLTDEQREKRQILRTKAEKRRMIQYKEHTKHLDSINVFMINAPAELVPTESVFELYSIRWQIEITFKMWKSIFHIDSVKPVKIERFECHLYGKLIALILCSSLMYHMREILLRKKKRELSEFKANSIFKKYFQRIDQALRTNTESEPLQQVLLQIYRMMEKNGQKSHRYDKKTVFDILGVVYELKRKGSQVAA